MFFYRAIQLLDTGNFHPSVPKLWIGQAWLMFKNGKKVLFELKICLVNLKANNIKQNSDCHKKNLDINGNFINVNLQVCEALQKILC